ncbi:hypothetical protein K501DRAFT_315827 [Backusella circina FSU 941]|nr:hypothetical protein K501DRAFT_315827 [Backusella circina FSU 941]
MSVTVLKKRMKYALFMRFMRFFFYRVGTGGPFPPINRPEQRRQVPIPFKSPINNPTASSASATSASTSIPITSAIGNATVTISVDQFNEIMETVKAVPELRERIHRAEMELALCGSKAQPARPIIPATEPLPPAQDFDPVRHLRANSHFKNHIARYESFLWRWGTEKGFNDPYNEKKTEDMIEILGKNHCIDEGGNRQKIREYLYKKYHRLNKLKTTARFIEAEKVEIKMIKRREQRGRQKTTNRNKALCEVRQDPSLAPVDLRHMCSREEASALLVSRKMSLELSDVEEDDQVLLGTRYVGKRRNTSYVKEPEDRTHEVGLIRKVNINILFFL